MTKRRTSSCRTFMSMLAVSGAAAGFVLAPLARAQDGPGGALVTFGVSNTLRYEQNDPGRDDSSLRTDLSFGISSETSSQSFTADGGILAELGEDGFDLRNPGLRLSYGWQNRPTALNLNLRYRERDVDGLVPVLVDSDGLILDEDDLFEDIFFISDPGTREDLRLGATLVTGRDARFGTETSLGYRSRVFSGTADPDLTDLVQLSFDTSLRFEISPRITLRTGYGYSETDEDDLVNTFRTSQRASVGTSLRIDPLWTADIGLRFSEFETKRDDELGNRTVTTEEGLGFSAGATRAFRNGSLGVSVARIVSEDGEQDSLRFSRDLELGNGAQLDAAVSLVRFEDGELAPTVTLAYAQTTRSGRFTLDLRQSAEIDDDRDVRKTRLAASYRQAINASSSWSLNGSLASTDVLDGDTGDRTQVRLGLGYNYALTRDWDLSTRWEHRVNYADGAEDSSRNVISLNLERSFSFRP